MDRQEQIGLLKRLLQYVDTKTTSMANAPWRNDVSVYTDAQHSAREQQMLFRLRGRERRALVAEQSGVQGPTVIQGRDQAARVRDRQPVQVGQPDRRPVAVGEVDVGDREGPRDEGRRHVVDRHLGRRSAFAAEAVVDLERDRECPDRPECVDRRLQG